MTEQQCAAQHFGPWAAKLEWLNAQVAAFNAGTLKPVESVHRNPVIEAAGKLPKSVYMAGDNSGYVPPLYTVDVSGIGFVGIDGQLTKGRSSFGGTSNIRVRRAIRMAESDPDVRGIMLTIDSPGGTVAGQQAMADEISRVARSGRKPIFAHAEDSMHSAALWAGVQAQRVTASAMTEIGSIGTVATVADYSEAAAKDGIKVHVVSTGPDKGAFTPGTEITEYHLGKLKVRVEQLNEFFLNAVKTGRNMPIAKVRDLATGEDWMAADAKAHGLIDEVMSQDEAVKSFRRMLDGRDRASRSASRGLARAVRLAELDS